MPNHVFSHWQVSGLAIPEIQEIKSNLKVAPEEFQSNFMGSYIPEPKDSEDYQWKQWRCENWGSKWDAFDIQVSPAPPHCLDLCFNTAWDPPNENFLRAISARYPDAVFCCQYQDEFRNFVGISVAQDGVAYDRRIDPDKFLPEELRHPDRDGDLGLMLQITDPDTGEVMQVGPHGGADQQSSELSDEQREHWQREGHRWHHQTLDELVSMLPARD